MTAEKPKEEDKKPKEGDGKEGCQKGEEGESPKLHQWETQELHSI